MDAESARRQASIDDSFGGARRLAADPDYFGNPDQQRLGRMLHADSPDFQDWPTFIQLYFDLNPSLQGRFRSGGDSSGELYQETIHRHRRQQALAEAFIGGKYVSPSGSEHQLADLPRVRARAGETAILTDANGQPIQLDAAARARLRGDASMRVDDAVALRQHLIEQHAQLEHSGGAHSDTLKEIRRLIIDLSEALGETAGLRYAEQLPGGQDNVLVARSSGEVDILHIGPEPDSVVTWIECKGGVSALGSRVAEQGGRPVRADQTTPEYMRSIANALIARGRKEQGNAILQALDKGPPFIQVVVVRQPFDSDSGALQPVTVTDYPVTRKGL
jgi:hypothetical protein